MAYQLNQKDILDFAQTQPGTTKIKGDELFFEYCPYCSGGKGNKRDRHTMSINVSTGVFKCFRSTCGKQGHFVELARDFNFKLDFKDKPKLKVYRKLPSKDIVSTEEAIAYMETRGISRSVSQAYEITTRKDNSNTIVFPFKDENNVLISVKYRNTKYNGTGCKEWFEKDTKPILFGMQHCKDFDTLYITEGQMDSLTLTECGIKNATSVPTGASGFTWLEHLWEWVTKFKEVVVFGDFENGQITLIDTLQKRLPLPVKCVRQVDYLGEKDANAIYLKYGAEAIRTACEQACIVPVKCVKELADVEQINIYELEKVRTNIQELDRIIGGFYMGQVVLLTGKRGEGKSTLMSQFVVEALDQNFNTFVYSGELTDYHFKNWFDLQAAGIKNTVQAKNKFGEDVYYVDEKTVARINRWHKGRAYIYDNTTIDEKEPEELIVTIEKAIQRFGIKFVCLDNLMTALDVDLNNDLYRAQSQFVKKLKILAMKYNVAVLLVAHPRKTSGNLDNDSVSGSGDITNRVDTVLAYSRNTDFDIVADSLIYVTKNRLTGVVTNQNTAIKADYSPFTKRISTQMSKDKHYSWESFDVSDETKEAEEDLPM